MLTITSRDVVAEPFPHVIKQGILPDELYRALREDFPGTGVFKGQSDSYGGASSRTGSGYDVYRGDPAYSELTERSPAWREFSDFINSEAFVDQFRSVFADHLDDIGLRVDIRRSHVEPDYFEPRQRLTETATVGDKIASAANSVIDKMRPSKPVAPLFTRLDIHRSRTGYAKVPHCDRPNRLCSLIVYFTDAEEAGLEGGDLLIYAHNKKKPVNEYERHPHPENVTEIARLRPKQNLGVFFPCQNNSYHGVTEVKTPGVDRDYLYINISGRTRSLW